MAKLAESHYVMSDGNLMVASIKDKCTSHASNSQTFTEGRPAGKKGTQGGLLNVRNDDHYCHFDAFVDLNTYQLAHFVTFTKDCRLFSSTGRQDLLRWFISGGTSEEGGHFQSYILL